MSLDWLIVGAGVHGVHIALALLGGAGVERGRLRLLDPHPAPLTNWRRCATTVGMRFMRSPAVHHLDGPPFSLTNFAREEGFNRKRDFRLPYNRPSMRLFDAHCEALFDSTNLSELCIRGRALDIEDAGDRLEIVTEQGRLEARQVVLALGSDRLARPHWAQTLEQAGLRLAHVFDDDFELDELAGVERLAIVGGGISAVQFALARRGWELIASAPADARMELMRASADAPDWSCPALEELWGPAPGDPVEGASSP